MANSPRRKQLLDAYRIKGFTAIKVKGTFGDPKALIIELARRSKKRSAALAVMSNQVGMTASNGECAIYHVVTGAFILSSIYVAFIASGVMP